MIRLFARFNAAIAAIIICAIIVSGCGPSRGPNVGNGGGGGGGSPAPATPHFSPVKNSDPNSVNSYQIINGSRTSNEGLVCWLTPTSAPVGAVVEITVVVYFGPYGGDNNTLNTTDAPHLFPNYDQGAEVGRTANDYQPIKMELFVGGGNQLWKAKISRFPTNGRFLFTVTRNGNSLTEASKNTYMAGLQNDSSFVQDKSSLSARYDSNTRRAVLP